jgi:hypothetical protein
MWIRLGVAGLLLAGVSVGAHATSAHADLPLAITAQPVLFPAFRPLNTDYIVRCPTGSVTVNVNAPTGTTVSVDSQPGQTGQFSQSVLLSRPGISDRRQIGLDCSFLLRAMRSS